MYQPANPVRYKLTVAYDGTDFCGWQKQEPPEQMAGAAAAHVEEGLDVADGRIALRTVQALVERAVREVVREPVILHGASRTDSGVHAKAQCAAFTCSGRDSGATESRGNEESPLAVSSTQTPMPHAAMSSAPQSAIQNPKSEIAAPRGSGWPLARGTDRLMMAINGRLPPDVLVTHVEPVALEFNPISDARAKGYSYTIAAQRERPLWDRRFVTHIYHPLNVAAMEAAAASFIGEFDFAAFSAAGHGRQSTVRTIFDCRVTRPALDRIRIDVSGNGFLYNMVRIIAGTLVEVGKCRMSAEDVTRAIESKDRRNAGPTMPPEGLCLEWIRYPDSLT